MINPNSCPECHTAFPRWKEIDSYYKDNGKNYSFAKGALGTALFGPVGAVAGLGGKKPDKVVIYQCQKCGYTFKNIYTYGEGYK